MAEPLIVGIESSSRTCAVGLARGRELIKERKANGANIHSKMLLPFIEEVCAAAGISLGEIEALVLSAGPGSFTGLRIGYSVAKGIGHVRGIPLIEVPTLDVWAHQAGTRETPVVPLIDAYRGELFYALYRHGPGDFARISEFRCSTPEEMSQVITGPVLFTGSGVPAFKEKLREILGDRARFPELLPGELSMESLLTLGFRSFHAGRFANTAACEPLYLRKFKGVS